MATALNNRLITAVSERNRCALSAALLARSLPSSRFLLLTESGRTLIDRFVEFIDPRVITGNQQSVPYATAFGDQPGCRQVERVDQQRRRKRGKTDRLVRTVGQDRGDFMLQLANRHHIANLNAKSGHQGAVRPHRSRRRDAFGNALLAEQIVSNTNLAAQRVAVADALDRRQGAQIFGEDHARKSMRLGRSKIVFGGQLVPFLRNRIRCLQPKIGRQDFICLAFHRPPDAVGQKADRGQRRNRKCNGRQQHDHFAGT